MFKKIMNIMFVVLITVAPVLSMANTNAGAEIRTASLEVGNTVFKDDSKLQLAKSEQVVVSSGVYQKSNQNQSSIPVNGWFLFSMLLGFVMLSNRMTI